LAIGNFDGVHRGHRQIIEEARTIAVQKGVKLAVMTFDPHPRQVLGAGVNYDHQLTPLPIKLELFAELGVEISYVVHFDREFAALPAEQFVDQFLCGLHAVTIVVGFDYRFGAGGRADAGALREMCGLHATNVHIVPAVNLYGEKISSSVIREKLLTGEVKLAAELLGRPFQLLGQVVSGEGRGKLLGFPTANLEPLHKYVLPRTGVYVVRGQAMDTSEQWNGLMNVGYKPTFHEEERHLTLEAHFFDLSDDLYRRMIKIEFLDFLRSEKKFNSAGELVNQIRTDIMEAKRRLSY
jgi:riboflavin kinase/FMN adenylyltransferase